MNYIVFDLEYNQHFNYFKENKKNLYKNKCPFEIIQIGAIKLDKNLKTIGTFDKLVKPVLYKRIHPYVKKITGITRADLTKEKKFPEVYAEFTDFISSEEGVFCIWGGSDMTELFKNIHCHQLDDSLVFNDYIDVQSYATHYLDFKKGNTIGLSTAVEELEIPKKNEFHDAFNDAHYTAEIFKMLYDNNNMRAEKYSYQKSTQDKLLKPVVDTVSLLKQFEKMLDRNLTSKEKEMIKLAYYMGKTNQFTFKEKEKE